MEGNVLEISPCSQLTQLRSRPQPAPGEGGPPAPAVLLRSSGWKAGDDRRSPPGHGRPLPGLGGAAAPRDGLREAGVRGSAARGACRAARCEVLRRARQPGENLICLPVLGMSEPLLFTIKTKQTPYTPAQVFCPCPSPRWVGGEPRAAACSAARGTTQLTSTLTHQCERSQLPTCGARSLLARWGTAGGEHPPKLHSAQPQWCWKALHNTSWQLSRFTFLGLLSSCSAFYPPLPGLWQPGKDS